MISRRVNDIKRDRTKKINIDNYTRSNRENFNITIAIFKMSIF